LLKKEIIEMHIHQTWLKVIANALTYKVSLDNLKKQYAEYLGVINISQIISCMVKQLIQQKNE
jgi:hypothetical protein